MIALRGWALAAVFGNVLVYTVFWIGMEESWSIFFARAYFYPRQTFQLRNTYMYYFSETLYLLVTSTTIVLSTCLWIAPTIVFHVWCPFVCVYVTLLDAPKKSTSSIFLQKVLFLSSAYFTFSPFSMQSSAWGPSLSFPSQIRGWIRIRFRISRLLAARYEAYLYFGVPPYTERFRGST